MKFKIFLLLSLFALSSVSSLFSQKSGFKNIQSLKLSSRMTTKLHKNQVKAFTVNKQGILTPNTGYHIVQHIKSNTIYIKLKDTEFSTLNIQEKDKKEIAPNVTMYCNGCDACEVDCPSNQAGVKYCSCQGNCDDNVSCWEIVVVKPSEDIGVQ